MSHRFQLRTSDRQQAYSLVEMLFAVAIFGVVMATIASTMMFTTRSFEVIGNYSDMDRNSHFALDNLSRDIRNAANLTFYATNQITLANLDGSSVTYSWDPLTRVFIRQTSLSIRTNLTQCDYLSFDIYQRTPAYNFSFYSAAGNPSQAKLIAVTWRCSRQIYGKTISSESVQTAKFAMRN